MVEGLVGLWGWFHCKVPAAVIKFLDHTSLVMYFWLNPKYDTFKNNTALLS